MEFGSGDGNPSGSKGYLQPRKRYLEGLEKRDLGKEPVYAWGSMNNVGTDPRIDFLTKTYLESGLSCDEIVEISNKRAGVETLLAAAAREEAEKKAIKAANAIAFAKGALETVAVLTEEAERKHRDAANAMVIANRALKKLDVLTPEATSFKKSKTMKHVAAKTVNKKRGNAPNSKADEELARNLHFSMNKSPQFVKKSANSDVETYTDKRGKGPKVSSKGLGKREAAREGRVGGVFGSLSNQVKDKSLKIGDGVAEPSHLKERVLESSDDLAGVGKKIRVTEQKKLPLNVCSSKDLSIANDEVNVGKSSAGLNSVGIRVDTTVPMDPEWISKIREFRPPKRYQFRQN